ncbi:nitronate monooxygenase [Inquilinus sp. OTU3971]|uniref:nitronate monooxygenase n=1 Tax=Inquilinus sp. OTU3971 TaxID=3043855 RepID=UPI00313DB5A7
MSVVTPLMQRFGLRHPILQACPTPTRPRSSRRASQETRLTRAFSGRPARGIVNRFMTAIEPPGETSAALPFPLQNALTRPLRGAAGKAGRAEFLSLWAGQGLRLARRQPAAETEAAIARLKA